MAGITSASTRRNEIGAVYAAGLLQGLALVTFPAAATILTNAADYGLSSAQYGAMFLPQAVTAVAASLAGGRLAAQVGLKRVLLLGLAANVIAMALLLASQVGMGSPLGYGLLLLATASLGVGFGLTVPSLNTYAAVFYPARVDRATLYLNALLGLGTALAPVIAAIFLGSGCGGACRRWSHWPCWRSCYSLCACRWRRLPGAQRPAMSRRLYIEGCLRAPGCTSGSRCSTAS